MKTKILHAALVAVEAEGAKLTKGSLQAISAAKKLNAGNFSIFLKSADAVEAARKISGVEKVFVVEKSVGTEQIAEILKFKSLNFTHVVAPNSSFWKDTLPRVAALLDVQSLSDVLEISSTDTFKRPIYAGNAIATFRMLDKIKIFTVRTTAFPPAESAEASALVEVIKDQPGNFNSSTVLSQDTKPPGRADLATASRVVSGGRALKSKDNFENILGPLCDKLGAALGASRAAVDAGFVSNDLQVGQTGKVVAPELYIAVGISGAVQHLAGMKDSKVIVAINRDPEAAIFQVADYGLVADAFEAVPEFTRKI